MSARKFRKGLVIAMMSSLRNDMSTCMCISISLVVDNN